MHRRMLLAHPAESDAGVLTASGSASSDTGPTNLQTMQPKEVWRELTGGSLFLELDRGAVAEPWDLILLLFNNAGSGDTIRIRTADTQGNLTASPTMDQSSAAWPTNGSAEDNAYLDSLPYVHSYLWLGDDVTDSERWVRLDLSVTSPKLPVGYVGDPFFQSGRLYVTKAYRPPHDKDKGFTVNQKERGAKRTPTYNGGLRVRPGSTYKETTFNMGFLTRLEALAEPWVMAELRGEHSDIVVIEDPGIIDAAMMKTTLYGLASAIPTKHGGPDVYSRRYKIETLEA